MAQPPLLQQLPAEVLLNIFSSLNQPDLVCLALSGKALYHPAKSALDGFCQLNPSEASLARFDRVLSRPERVNKVHTLHIQTTEKPWRQLGPTWYETGAIRDSAVPKIPQGFAQAVGKISHFKGLEKVAIDFDDLCAENDLAHYLVDEPPETCQFRRKVLKLLFAALEQVPTGSLRELQFRNLQDATSPIASTGPSILRSISTLRIDLISESEDDFTVIDLNNPTRMAEIVRREDHFRQPNYGDFFVRLAHLFRLREAGKHLTSVSLAVETDMMFGYLPECYFPPEVLPNLENLALTRYTFGCEKQIEGLLAHKKLRSLHLNDCAILHYIILDSESSGVFSFSPHSEIFLDNDAISRSPIVYPARWHHYFRKIASELPRLKEFRFGTYNFTHGADPSYDGEAVIELPSSRYLTMDERPAFAYQVFKEEITVEDLNEFDDDDSTLNLQPVSRPDCDEADRRALEDLLASLKH